MKKIFLMAVVFSFVYAASAFATCSQSDTVYTCGANGTNPAWTVNLSKNVTLDYNNGTSGISYAISGYHSNGDKTYGTSSGDTKIYYQNGTNVSAPSAPANGTSTASWGSGWNPM